jgi:pimeloyl-ACP methyl ester carboxylesterase
VRFFDHLGLRLAYDIVGAGPAIVLHTGAGGDSRMWRDAGYVAGLARFKVVLLDHRGHGHSDAPADPDQHAVEDYAADVLALADELALDRFAFWGYSNGACVGYELAATQPKRIEALVASGGVEGPDHDPTELCEAAHQVREGGIRAILGDEDASEWLIRQLVDETDAEVVARELECFAGWSPWPLFPRIVAPTLIVAGEHESENCEAAAAAIRHGRTVVLSGLGHLGAFAHSEFVLPHVLPFLDGITGRD